jgi:putative SOS response-associated peptidase YedK
MVIRRFFENVPVERYLENNKLPQELKDRENIVICFEPENTEFMYVPFLWDTWEKRGQPQLLSAALITDDPAPEIQEVGHDRTPVFLKESAIESWLQAESLDEALAALASRETPYYAHRLLGIAA